MPLARTPAAPWLLPPTTLSPRETLGLAALLRRNRINADSWGDAAALAYWRERSIATDCRRPRLTADEAIALSCQELLLAARDDDAIGREMYEHEAAKWFQRAASAAGWNRTGIPPWVGLMYDATATAIRRGERAVIEDLIEDAARRGEPLLKPRESRAPPASIPPARERRGRASEPENHGATSCRGTPGHGPPTTR